MEDLKKTDHMNNSIDIVSLIMINISSNHYELRLFMMTYIPIFFCKYLILNQNTVRRSDYWAIRLFYIRRSIYIDALKRKNLHFSNLKLQDDFAVCFSSNWCSNCIPLQVKKKRLFLSYLIKFI